MTNDVKKLFAFWKKGELDSIIVPLAKKHSIENTAALHSLFTRLQIISEYGSAVILEGGQIRWAEDYENWSPTKKIFEKAFKASVQLYDAIEKLRENALAMQVVGVLDEEQTYPKISTDIEDLCRIFDKARRINSEGGMPRRRDWSYEAVKLCEAFWKENQNEEPKPYFREKNAAKAGNAFTQWFCEIMKIATKTTNTKCKTFLED